MITATPTPALGGVYKLVEIEDANGNSIPKMKLSNEQEKATLPGRKTVWRLYDSNGLLKEDIIALDDEKIEYSGKFRKIHMSFVEQGEVVFQIPPLKEIHDQAQKNLSLLPEEHRVLDAASSYPVKLSTGLEKLTQNLSRSLQSPELKKTGPK